METPIGLKRTQAVILTRYDKRLSWLYLDLCRIEQDDNGTIASINTVKGPRHTYLPSATLTTLLLGPGTSITQPAVAALTRNGCGIVFTGSGAVRSYGSFLSPFSSTRLLTQQARISTQEDLRTQCARRMYDRRFHGTFAEALPPDITIETMRGIEGAKMKTIYKHLAAKYRIGSWRRQTIDPIDPVNIALNHANAALYGTVDTVIQGLGMAPGLGIIHTGNRRAFTLDIADLYKADTTIPAAFAAHKAPQPDQAVMASLRENFRLIRLIPRIINDIHYVFNEQQDNTEWDVNTVSLWNEENALTGGNAP